MADEYPGVIPMLSYADGLAAMDWLVRAFGFRERMRMAGPKGELAHGELETDDGLVMLASPTPEYQGPRAHREGCERARRWAQVPWVIDGVLVHVADVDAHFAVAQREGATILSEPKDDGHGRGYRAEDLEGHRWMFQQR
jgi:uncharacterized glyoxalase superfamily protein PhnB